MRVTIQSMKDDLDALAQRLGRIEESLNQHAAKTNEMYEAFMPAKAGFALIAGVGRAAKPVFWIIALAAAVGAWWKTGNFTWPQL